ncbi:MAG: hypothetical protein AB7F99_07805 [Vicinamibacterales bacterium]
MHSKQQTPRFSIAPERGAWPEAWGLKPEAWRGRDPIGHRLRPCCSEKTPWFTVVGVAADVKQGGIDKKAGTEIYFSLDQIAHLGWAIGTMHVVVRTTAPFEEAAPVIRDVAREIDPTVPIVRLRELDDVLQESIRRPRLLSYTVSIFAGLALLIALIGTYGLLSYTVTNRRRGRRRRHGRGHAGLLDSRVARLTCGPAASHSRGLALKAAEFRGNRPHAPATCRSVQPVA